MAKASHKKLARKQAFMPFSLLGDSASAFILLSRIPVFWFRFDVSKKPDFTRSLWAFPIVGLIIGIGAGCLLLPVIIFREKGGILSKDNGNAHAHEYIIN